MEKPTKDETYFMQIIVFQAENILFQVPRYQFEKNSEIFASTFLLPTGDNVPEGSSEAAPFRLEGVSASDFRNFLAGLYPLSGSPELSKDHWISILKLSTMWRFLDLRQDAITKLLSFPMTAQAVVLGHSYSSVELFTAGCTALASRPTSLSDDEAKELGYEMAFWLCILREKLHHIQINYSSPVQPELTRIFEKQLSVMTEEEALYGARKPRQPPSRPQQSMQQSKKRRKH
ncbi:hypothetical protein BYT27DRAFT_7244638 [Phlegmacium glaucopus]|nr:hypothetical protein BYT27DRAFT_7244638 [Phlegmacium glaucopus]